MEWGRQFSADEVEGMTSEEFGHARSAAASIQRGRPESAMNRAQHALGGGVYPHALEHIGDLTHRMNESGGRFGLEFVKPKVETTHASLHHGYGFEREMGEQIEENQRYHARETGREMPSLSGVASMGKEYANEHRKVPVYSIPNYIARSAAVNLGEMQFDKVRRNLTALKSDISVPEGYKEMTSQGSAVKFLRGLEADPYRTAHVFSGPKPGRGRFG